MWSNTNKAVSLFIFGNYLRSSRDDLGYHLVGLKICCTKFTVECRVNCRSIHRNRLVY